MSTRFKSSRSKQPKSEKVKNFMEGNSYTLNPIDTLKIVAASSIFGEPSYYRGSHNRSSCLKNILELQKTIFSDLYTDPSKTTTDIFTKVIDEALDYNFKTTVEYALTLRKDFMMRLNPSVILVRASIHKDRAGFSKKYPGLLREIGKEIILRPDDITNQFEYYKYLNSTKKNLPGIVKRIWSDKLSSFSKYHLAKYKSKGLVDMIRISHAHSEVIDELMKTGTIQLDDNEMTWEKLRSEGKDWKEIFNTISIPHMALLRNLRGIFSEEVDSEFANEVLDKLLKGVEKGKQFPFRYYSAYNEISKADVNYSNKVLSALEDCIDLAMKNFPTLEGKTMCLSDNSASAHGALTSEYGSTTVASIDNLSSLMTATNSDEGYVGVFGDRLRVIPITSKGNILKKHKEINDIGKDVGGSTENGIWLFWDKAIKEKQHWDNVFIYSDQQAGHGGLYGVNASDYRDFATRGGRYIDVLALVKKYREEVNPKVNVFSIQTAGYDNMVMPENFYRSTILAGWTGKETLYAKEIIDFWNQKEQITPLQ